MRLAKRLAQAGIASRRASERLIAEGRVSLRGQVSYDPATDVSEDEPITVDGRQIASVEPKVMYALNKPIGVLSTARDPLRRPTVVEMIDDPRRLYPVGRLDRDSEGLMLLSNDGQLAYALTHPKFEVEKAYEVRTATWPLSHEALAQLRAGLRLTDGMTAPAKVRQIDGERLEVRIHEGRNRQVRRMLEAVGYEVKALKRIAFGPLRLASLPPGGYRQLSAKEVDALRRACSGAGEGPGLPL